MHGYGFLIPINLFDTLLEQSFAGNGFFYLPVDFLDILFLSSAYSDLRCVRISRLVTFVKPMIWLEMDL